MLCSLFFGGFFGDKIVSNFKTTMIFRRWVLSISKRQATCVTNTLLKFATYGNLGHLCMIDNFGRKTIMQHTGQLKKKLSLQSCDLQHKSLCSCSLLSGASEISIISWFQNCCGLPSLYANSMQNWNLWRKALIALNKEKYFLRYQRIQNK